MYSNSVFAKHFNELLSGGVHILGTVLSQERRLQVAEIYGASLSENGGILRLLVSQNHWPDFYKALMNKQDIAVVFSSPMTMLIYQIKGQCSRWPPRAGICGEVVGVGRSQATLDTALRLGIVDAITSDWASALRGADLVLLGMPVGQMAGVMQAMVPHLGPDTVETDAGSTKADVIAAARACLGAHAARFVPGHPIGGAERSGGEAARADLFDGKRVVLTPLDENPPACVEAVAEAWRACGARVSQLSGAEHNRVFAAVSHLPHLLAFALVHEFAGRANADQLFGFAASGSRDFTRRGYRRSASASPSDHRKLRRTPRSRGRCAAAWSARYCCPCPAR